MLAINTTPDNTWVIDSGASHHMCNNRNLFLPNTITKTNYTIRLGDKTTVEAIEQGIIPINQVHINALFVPRFRVSLLSVSQLDSQLKWFTTFAQGECQIHDNAGNMVLKTPCSRGLYQVRISEIITAYHVKADALPKPKASTELWHRRMAHIHPAAMKRLLDTGAGQQDFGIDKIGDDVPATCETCIRTKLKQRFNRQPVKRSTIPFELVHSDLCGPMTSSVGGASYYIVYIDDCTRYIEIFLLVSKTATEIVQKFEAYKAWVESQGYKIRRFRCDNGTGEYANSSFLNLLTLSGISFEPSPPYTQHKNGVSERMIQTLNSKARSLLQDAELPPRFWAEAIKTAAYLHRRTPTASLDEFKTPFEALYGTAPPLHHLRRFGCIVYRHIPKEQRKGKFADRARPCMFLGYVHKTTKIYRIWDFTGRGRALESSNVRFLEHKNAWTSRAEHEQESRDQDEDVFPENNEGESSCDGESELSPRSPDELPVSERDILPRSSGELPASVRDIPPWSSEELPASVDVPVGNTRCTYKTLNEQPPRAGELPNPSVQDAGRWGGETRNSSSS